VVFMYAVEGGALGLAEGLGASLATITSLMLAMDHDVLFALAPVGATASIVTKLLVRVHVGSLLAGLRTTDKDAAEPAFFATQLSSTVAWGSTSYHYISLFVLFFDIAMSFGHLFQRTSTDCRPSIPGRNGRR